MAVNQMEFDYLMLICGTNNHVVDEMIPNNKERIAHLIRAPSGAPFIHEASGHGLTRESAAVETALEGSNDLDHVVMSFKQEIDHTQIPAFVGYTDILEMLYDLFEIPQLFKHLTKPGTSIWFQGILLFGPPGTGKHCWRRHSRRRRASHSSKFQQTS